MDNMDNLDMMLKKCRELCNVVGKKLPEIVMDRVFSYGRARMDYGHDPETTKETVAKEVADMYICLLSVALALNLDGNEIGRIGDAHLLDEESPK